MKRRRNICSSEIFSQDAFLKNCTPSWSFSLSGLCAGTQPPAGSNSPPSTTSSSSSSSSSHSLQNACRRCSLPGSAQMRRVGVREPAWAKASSLVECQTLQTRTAKASGPPGAAHKRRQGPGRCDGTNGTKPQLKSPDKDANGKSGKMLEVFFFFFERIF